MFSEYLINKFNLKDEKNTQRFLEKLDALEKITRTKSKTKLEALSSPNKDHFVFSNNSAKGKRNLEGIGPNRTVQKFSSKEIDKIIKKNKQRNQSNDGQPNQRDFFDSGSPKIMASPSISNFQANFASDDDSQRRVNTEQPKSFKEKDDEIGFGRISDFPQIIQKTSEEPLSTSSNSKKILFKIMSHRESMPSPKGLKTQKGSWGNQSSGQLKTVCFDRSLDFIDKGMLFSSRRSLDHGPTLFSQKSLDGYLSKTKGIDDDIAAKVAGFLKENASRLQEQEEENKESELSGSEATERIIRAPDEERSLLGFFDKRRIYLRVPTQKRVFPLNVSIETSSEEVLTFVSRKDERPGPNSYEMRFITKEFKVSFNDSESIGQTISNLDIFMMIQLKQLRRAQVNLSFSGSVNEKRLQANEALKHDPMTRRKKKSFSKNFVSYLEYYRKKYIGEEALLRSPSQIEQENPRKPKWLVLKNIQSQGNFKNARNIKLASLVNNFPSQTRV